jgi:uncharacterized protein (TIGR00369 family)
MPRPAKNLPENSTTVRSNLALEFARVGLHMAFGLGDNLGAAVAARLFTSPRRHPRPERERTTLATGHAFPVEVPLDAPRWRGATRTLAAWRWGEGPTVLLVHGWEGRGSQLGAFVEPLVDAGMSVVTFDAPGHGDSPGRQLYLTDAADAVGAVAARVGPLHGFVAHSFGAPAVLLAYHRHGVDAARNVFVAPNVLIDDAVFRFTQVMMLGGRERGLLEGKLAAHTGIYPSSLTLEGLVGDRDAGLLVIHDEDDRDVAPVHRAPARRDVAERDAGVDGRPRPPPDPPRPRRDRARGRLPHGRGAGDDDGPPPRDARQLGRRDRREPPRRLAREGVVTAKVIRTYEYDGRTTDVAQMLAMSGLDYLRGILRGDFPGAPIASTLGFTLAEVEPGRAVFTGVPHRYVYNPLGGVHGGWAATLLDSAMGCAVHSTLPAGKGYATTDLAIHLVRGLSEKSGTIRCEARVIHTGGSIATAEGRLVDGSGALYAHATTTCLILTPGR